MIIINKRKIHFCFSTVVKISNYFLLSQYNVELFAGFEVDAGSIQKKMGRPDQIACWVNFKSNLLSLAYVTVNFLKKKN